MPARKEHGRKVAPMTACVAWAIVGKVLTTIIAVGLAGFGLLAWFAKGMSK
jgi:hypothetical protein